VASRAESRAVNLAGLVQGVALVTFPAASTILTNPADYGLSSSQYGAMFLPQVVLAIAASLAGARLVTRHGAKRLLLVGLAFDLSSMALLVVSWAFIDNQSAAYAILLLATACLGAGFGLAVPTLNTLAARFHPDHEDGAVLTLNALLGLGTVLAPVLVAIFVGLDVWLALPLSVATALVVLLIRCARLPLHAGTRRAATASRPPIPSRFWLFAGFAVLYGFCETMNGNWSQLDMTQNLGASVSTAALALTAFWGMVTAGRLFFARVAPRFPAKRTFHLLPFVLAGAFVLIALLPDDTPLLGVAAFGLAGIGCSALLPLTISFGQEQLAAVSASMAGLVIAFYQGGYGIAALGVGPLESAGVELSTIFGFAALVAIAMGALSFAVTGRGPAPEGATAA
jgi:MFS family permease